MFSILPVEVVLTPPYHGEPLDAEANINRVMIMLSANGLYRARLLGWVFLSNLCEINRGSFTIMAR